MAEQVFKLPDIGEGIAEAEIAEWLVKVGDVIREDDTICEVTTDKATVEIPAAVSGRVTWLGGKTGEVMAIGSELIRIETDDSVEIAPSSEDKDPEPEVAEKPVEEPAPKAAESKQESPAPKPRRNGGGSAAPVAGPGTRRPRPRCRR